MSRHDTDENLFAAADGAFDSGPYPGIVDGIYNRNRRGERVDYVHFWASTRARATELLWPDPLPGWDYALTEVAHCGSQKEHGVPEAAATTCSGRYLRRVVSASSARVIVLLGDTTLHDFETEFGDGLNFDNRLSGPVSCWGGSAMWSHFLIRTGRALTKPSSVTWDVSARDRLVPSPGLPNAFRRDRTPNPRIKRRAQTCMKPSGSAPSSHHVRGAAPDSCMITIGV